jgi:hypothetical protein
MHINGLVKTIDDAIAQAEFLRLTTAAFILGMARLEVDQTELDNPEFMPTNEPPRKP